MFLTTFHVNLCFALCLPSCATYLGADVNAGTLNSRSCAHINVMLMSCNVRT